MTEKEELAILQAFGKALRSLREGQGLTQQALSDLSGVDRAFISEMELAVSTPSIISIFKLSGTLKVRPAEIIALTEGKLKDGFK